MQRVSNAAILSFSSLLIFYSGTDQENHPPDVKILAPANNSYYAWNSLVPWSIRVSDAEDGDSRFNELEVNEVYLQVQYVRDPSGLEALLQAPIKQDDYGFRLLRRANCVNCHLFDAKSIGPSWAEVSSRYVRSSTNVELLADRIHEGSSGIWGSTMMPSHPELTKDEVRAMVGWLLDNTGNKEVRYFSGTSGSFRLTPVPAAPAAGAFLLTASYVDHGMGDGRENELKGAQKIVIHGR